MKDQRQCRPQIKLGKLRPPLYEDLDHFDSAQKISWNGRRATFAYLESYRCLLRVYFQQRQQCASSIQLWFCWWPSQMPHGCWRFGVSLVDYPWRDKLWHGCLRFLWWQIKLPPQHLWLPQQESLCRDSFLGEHIAALCITSIIGPWYHECVFYQPSRMRAQKSYHKPRLGHPWELNVLACYLPWYPLRKFTFIGFYTKHMQYYHKILKVFFWSLSGISNK